MTGTFQRLYQATPFDPTDRQDQIGDAARMAVIDAALQTKLTMGVKGSEDLPALLCGLLVGLVQVMQATSTPSDQADAAIRTSIMQLTPWAVDMARAAEGKEPLANA